VVNSFVHLINRGTGVGHAAALVLFIALVFVLAWLVGRASKWLAVWLVDRNEAKGAPAPDNAAAIANLRQRETAIALVATTVRYVAFLIAFVLALVALSGGHTLQTVLGASFLVVVIGFAVQRFLMDVVAGLLMFFEGWFRIGDTVVVDAWRAQGVVEAVSLRSLTLRTIQGEIVYVPNSQVLTLRRIPQGYREVEVEFFASGLERGKQLVEEVAHIVPVGPTRFIRRPEVVDTEELAADLYRLDVRFAVAVGREWLAEDFLPTLIRQRAGDDLLVHGPIVTFVEEQAVRAFSRVSAASREALADRSRPQGRAVAKQPTSPERVT
jgi:small conductance mechanosensitive channel